MRYLSWTQLIICCASLLACILAATAYVFSCGPEADPYDYFTSFYNPNIAAGKGYEPFYYTSIAQYYGVDEPEDAANVQEWESFFSKKGAKVTPADIRIFVYTYTRSQMAALYAHIDKGTPLQAPDSVKNNTLTGYFIGSQDKETLGYLMYAKQCETYTSNSDVWNAPAPDSTIMMRLARNGIQLYNACKDVQLKERFAFQSIRMAHYSKTFATAIRYYDSLAAPLTSATLIHYKALALKAGALLRTGEATKSAYLFSRVFEGAPSQRTMAYLNAGWAGANKAAVLKLCSNNTEKATVVAMYAARVMDVNMAGLREVYRYDPTAPILDVLLAREVNKLESGYLQTAIDINGQPNYWYTGTGLTADAVRKMQKFTDSIAALGKVKDPALWQITSAYLCFIMKDYAGANTRLAAAQPKAQRPDLKDQLEIVQLLVNINSQPRIDKNYEDKLLASLKWLDSKLPKSDQHWYYWDAPGDNSWVSAAFYRRVYRNLLDIILAPRYARQGDVVREALTLIKRDSVDRNYYSWNAVTGKSFIEDSLSTDQLQALYDLAKSKRKTPFEEYLCSHLLMQEKELGEIIAINYVRQHDFTNALNWFKRSGSTRRSELVFKEQLQDFGYENPDSIRNGITEQAFAARMVELEKQMRGDHVPPAVYYEYATGLFSISYYGQSYHFSVNYRPSTWWYGPEHERTPFLREYFGCYRAETFYKKAADAFSDPEFKAKALFMAARCAQKHMRTAENEEWWYPATYSNPYFPLLVKDYKNTAFYRERIQECGYLRDFVKTVH